VIPIDAHPDLGEIALWIVLAFMMWLVLIAALNRLGVHASPMIAAPISWVLARAVISGLPELIHWAEHTVTTMTGSRRDATQSRRAERGSAAPR
jgi:hypothetical protein